MWHDYFKEEIEHIAKVKTAGLFGRVAGNALISPIASGVGVPGVIGNQVGMNNAIDGYAKTPEEARIMNDGVGFWTGAKTGITSLGAGTVGMLGGLGLNHYLGNEQNDLAAGLIGTAAMAVPTGYLAGKYFGREDALDARARRFYGNFPK